MRCGNSMVIDPALLEQDLHPRDEVVEVGDVREHVVAEQQVGGGLARDARRRSRVPKNSTSVGMPFSKRDLGDVGGRLDAEHGDLALAGRTAAGSRRWRRSRRPGCRRRGRGARSSARRSARSAPASSRSTRRSRRSRRRSARASRTPRAAPGSIAAHEGPQRVERLHRVRALGRQVGVGQRRHPEVGEDVIQGCVAEAADGATSASYPTGLRPRRAAAPGRSRCLRGERRSGRASRLATC